MKGLYHLKVLERMVADEEFFDDHGYLCRDLYDFHQCVMDAHVDDADQYAVVDCTNKNKNKWWFLWMPDSKEVENFEEYEDCGTTWKKVTL